MTRFQFWCLLLAMVALGIAAIASAAFRPVALFLCLVAAAMALWMFRKSWRGRGWR